MVGRVIALIVSIGALILVSFLATISAFFAKFVWVFYVLVGLLALSLAAWIIIDIVNSIQGRK